MAGWHHWLDGLESEWTPGVGDGQGGLVCCDSWGCKESDTAERLIWSESLSSRHYFRHWAYISEGFPGNSVVVKNPPANAGGETQVWSLGREDPREKEMATHSSSLAWKIPGTEEPGGLQFMGSQRVGHDWAHTQQWTMRQNLSLLGLYSSKGRCTKQTTNKTKWTLYYGWRLYKRKVREL